MLLYLCFCLGAGAFGALTCPLAPRQEEYYTRGTVIRSFLGWAVVAAGTLCLGLTDGWC